MINTIEIAIRRARRIKWNLSQLALGKSDYASFAPLFTNVPFTVGVRQRMSERASERARRVFDRVAGNLRGISELAFSATTMMTMMWVFLQPQVSRRP